MSRIVSPLPPVRINITLDEVTGLASMQCSKEIEFQSVAQTFAALMIQVIEMRLKAKPVTVGGSEQMPFEIAMLSLCKLMLTVISAKMMAEQMAKGQKNPFDNPFGKPDEKPSDKPTQN